ncbi:MAG: ABC transporter permease [Candidatus Sericytochromatia bacterium]|nr:ABC transporter permease [Candidatus Tanganyikabacteria bacterium]
MVDPAEVGRLAAAHLALSAAGVALSAAIAIPLGVYVTRPGRKRLADAVLAAAGMAQTIPSLAVIALAMIALGLGWAPALLALVLYGFLPVLHNTVAGFEGVPADLLEAAAGLGMSPGQILAAVEWPLALPVMLGGLRTCVVLTIGTAALAAEIGAPCLGNLIFQGVSTSSLDLTLAGAIPTALLAIGADLGLGALERRLVPAEVRA